MSGRGSQIECGGRRQDKLRLLASFAWMVVPACRVAGQGSRQQLGATGRKPGLGLEGPRARSG